MDFDKKCESNRGYQFAALKDSVTNTKEGFDKDR